MPRYFELTLIPAVLAAALLVPLPAGASPRQARAAGTGTPEAGAAVLSVSTGSPAASAEAFFADAETTGGSGPPETAGTASGPASGAYAPAGADERAARLARALSERGIPPLLATGLLSLLPVFELRGGIPVGIAVLRLNPLSVFAVCVLFNLVPVLPILLLLAPLRRLLGRVRPFSGLFRYLDRRVARQKGTIERFEELGLTLFVGIPLPVTGAWTGSILAALLGLRVLRSLLFIFLGILLAGVLVTLLTMLGVYGLIAAAALLVGFAAVYLTRLRRVTA